MEACLRRRNGFTPKHSKVNGLEAVSPIFLETQRCLDVPTAGVLHSSYDRSCAQSTGREAAKEKQWGDFEGGRAGKSVSGGFSWWFWCVPTLFV